MPSSFIIVFLYTSMRYIISNRILVYFLMFLCLKLVCYSGEKIRGRNLMRGATVQLPVKEEKYCEIYSVKPRRPGIFVSP
jgi:hypothetical protein